MAKSSTSASCGRNSQPKGVSSAPHPILRCCCTSMIATVQRWSTSCAACLRSRFGTTEESACSQPATLMESCLSITHITMGLCALPQVKALRCSSAVPSDADPAGQVGFLLLGYVPEPHTLHAGIRSLAAGSTLIYDQHGVTIHNYCGIADVLREAVPASPTDLHRSELRGALADAVLHSLMPDETL